MESLVVHGMLLAAGLFLLLTMVAEAQGSKCGDDELTTIYCLSPPYVFEVEEGKDKGLVTGGIYYIVEEMVKNCCGEQAFLNLTYRSPSPRGVEENFVDEHLAFPVTRSQLMLDLDLMVDGVTYLPVIETSGSFVLTAKGVRGNLVMDSIVGSWPLALVVLSTAGIAGFIIWGLDSYWNPEEFPTTFPRGAWEGTWWAFVTMTTVGYGDRSPRSIPGRIFGLVWMFTGIIIMAIFTAALVTALTADWPIGKGDIKGFRIGVQNGSHEESIAYLHGSKTLRYNSVEEMTEALLSGEDELDALLVDSLYGLYWADHLDAEGIEQVSSVHHQSVYGILIQGMSESTTGCFSKYVLRHRFRMLDFLEGETGHISRGSHHPTDKSQQLVGADMVTVYIMLGVWLSLILGAVLWEYVYKKHFPKKKMPCATRKAADNDRAVDPEAAAAKDLPDPTYGSMEMKSRNNVSGLR